MANLSKPDFISKWNSLFLNNSTGLITETRMRDFAKDIQDSFVSQTDFNANPSLPTGVSWVTVPTTTLTGSTYSFSSAQINVSGALKTISAGSFNIPLASTGKHRLDAIVVDYSATTPVYIRLAGTEVDANATALRPPIGANYLFVQDVDVSDGVIAQAATGNIKEIAINGAAKTFIPNAEGYVNLTFTIPSGNSGDYPVAMQTDPDIATTSISYLIFGIVTDVVDTYDALNSNTGVLSSHFTFNYKRSGDANWNFNVSFATLKPILINTTDAARRIYISANNTTSTVPAVAVFNIKRS